MQKKKTRKGYQLRLDEMIQALRDDIISGRLAIGAFLPSESDLEKQFQIGNSSVRKGLEQLVDEGLIEKIPRVGNRVISPGPERVTIKFGYFGSLGKQVEMEALIKEFHAQFPHIQVQSLELPSGNFSKALKEYMEAELLDVVLINNNTFQDFVEKDCTPLFEPLEAGDSFPSFLTEPFSREGQLLVQPFVYSPVVLCYNKHHFQEQGVPEPDRSWSWNDLFRYGEQLAIPNERFGFYFYLPSRNRWPIFLLQSGSEFHKDETGSYQLRGTPLMDGLEECRELLRRTDVFPAMLSESSDDAEAFFQDEKVSMIMTTYFFLNEMKQAQVQFDVAPLPLPHVGDNKTLLIIVGLAVNSKSKSKEAAKRFVQFLSSYEMQLRLRTRTLNIPAHERASESSQDELAYRPSRFSMYRELEPTYHLITALGLRNEQLKAIQRDVMLFLSGFHDRETLCDRVERKLRESVVIV
ncbi:extracellular solute-binding protein [Paenibacillus cremeus]|nr:extracellular solute-binding protein [Paenibacillus cremeus]